MTPQPSPSYVGGRIRDAVVGAPAPVRWFVFDAEALSYVDATGVHALKELIGSWGNEGITFVVARLKGPMQRTFWDVGLLDLVGNRHIYPTVRAAAEAARPAREGA